jgi:hypothetical protein
MAAVPLVALACAGITEVPTFDDWFGTNDASRETADGADG